MFKFQAIDPLLLLLLFMAILFIFTLIFIGSGIKILKEWERVAVFRFGKFHSIRGPGIIWAFPILDKLSARISLKGQQVSIDTGEIQSYDGASVRIVGEVICRVVDIEKVILAIENHKEVAEKASRHVVVETTESMAYDDIATNRNEFEDRVKAELESRLQTWGMKLVSVDLRVQRSNWSTD